MGTVSTLSLSIYWTDGFRSLSIWSIMKKKPTCTKEKAHGESESGESRWIVSERRETPPPPQSWKREEGLFALPIPSLEKNPLLSLCSLVEPWNE